VIKVRLRAIGIEILVAQDQNPTRRPRALVGEVKSAGMAEVEISGRGGSQPASILRAAQHRFQNRSGMLENAMRVGAAAPASSVLAKQSLVVPYL
jgi:hypothetical protein